MAKAPSKGDLVLLDLSPEDGPEQQSGACVLVVSNEEYHKYTRRAIICPIGDAETDFPMHVPLDGRTKMVGAVLCEQVKSLSIRTRNAEILEKLPPDLLDEVLERIMLSIE